MNKILLFGSSGFLGSETSKLLSNRSYVIDAVDKSKPDYVLKNVNFIEKSIEAFLLSNNYNLEQYELIIDAATILPFKNNSKNKMDSNIFSAKEIVKCKFNKNVNFIYVSSSGTYGKPSYVPIDNESPQIPLDLYGNSKLKAEKILLSCNKIKTLSIIRPKAILGTTRGGIFEIFFNLINKNIPLPLPNNGEQIMQFVDVTDVARLILYLAENKLGGIWPAAAPNPISLKEYLNILELKIGKNIKKMNLNPTIFVYFGYLLVNLKLINFTKWHFGGYSYDSYFEENWKPEHFEYKYSSAETFLRTAKYYLEFKN